MSTGQHVLFENAQKYILALEGHITWTQLEALHISFAEIGMQQEVLTFLNTEKMVKFRFMDLIKSDLLWLAVNRGNEVVGQESLSKLHAKLRALIQLKSVGK